MLLFLVKSQYKDEFVTAGGVPLSEVCLSVSLPCLSSHSSDSYLLEVNYVSCFGEDIIEHNGKQNSVTPILCRGGSGHSQYLHVSQKIKFTLAFRLSYLWC